MGSQTSRRRTAGVYHNCPEQPMWIISPGPIKPLVSPGALQNGNSESGHPIPVDGRPPVLPPPCRYGATSEVASCNSYLDLVGLFNRW